MSTLGGFSPRQRVEGRASIADLFPRGHRSGRYLFRFSDGELCVGQTLDVVHRYAQHRSVRQDITHVSLEEMSREALEEERCAVVEWISASGRVLRSVVLPPGPIGGSDLDLVVDREDQWRWLRDVYFDGGRGPRPVDPVLRRRYQQQYERFSRAPVAVDVQRVLYQYALAGLPAAQRTELSFWRCFPLPSEGVYAQIQVDTRQVVTASDGGDDVAFTFTAAATPLAEALTDRRFLRRHPGLWMAGGMSARGQDEVHLSVDSAAGASRLLSSPRVVAAIRKFNLRSMRVAACSPKALHCPDLADHLTAV